ncbi:hypothetical protein HAX54_011662 [Datura stramonium]|uniref:Uncharacterized protein n=1 Tax=Datura stramonium TaxID=4076 RepID=A0ABS8TIH0_DATST|nr:hypothetical protein [Datura stramonium]
MTNRKKRKLISKETTMGLSPKGSPKPAGRDKSRGRDPSTTPAESNRRIDKPRSCRLMEAFGRAAVGTVLTPLGKNRIAAVGTARRRPVLKQWKAA